MNPRKIEPETPEVLPRMKPGEKRPKFRHVLNEQELATLAPLGLPPLDPDGEEEWYDRAEKAMKPLGFGWHGPAVALWVDKKREELENLFGPPPE